MTGISSLHLKHGQAEVRTYVIANVGKEDITATQTSIPVGQRMPDGAAVATTHPEFEETSAVGSSVAITPF